MLKQITGDLLAIEEGVLLHQVNCRGATGGLAGALRRKYPYAFLPYLEACNEWRIGASDNPLGCIMVAQASLLTPRPPKRKLWVCHVFGQINPGPNTDLAQVALALEELSAQVSLKKMEWSDLPLYAPYLMGCGLGGGDWNEYSALLEKNLPDCIIVRRPND